MRFLLIDRITEWQPGRRATGVKNVALSEDFFTDHFPTQPILPGVLMIEGMAQLAGLLLEEGVRQETGRRVKALMSIIERAKFRRPVRPGDRLQYHIEVASVHELGARITARAEVEHEPVAECTLAFSFHEFDRPQLEERRRTVLSLWLQGLPRHDDEVRGKDQPCS